VVEPTKSAPSAEAELSETTATDDAEPSNAELEKASSAAGNGAKQISVTYKPNVRSHREGSAKRPQPQNKPRSQRKK
jgi:hypothetical protein